MMCLGSSKRANIFFFRLQKGLHQQLDVDSAVVDPCNSVTCPWVFAEVGLELVAEILNAVLITKPLDVFLEERVGSYGMAM